MSVVMTVFVLNLHHRGPNKQAVPYWLKEIIVNKISPYLCLHEDTRDTVRVRNHEEKFIKNVSLKITLDNIQQALQNEAQIDSNKQVHNTVNGSQRQTTEKTEQTVQGIHSAVSGSELSNQTNQTGNHVVYHTLAVPTSESPPQQQYYKHYNPATNEYKTETGQQTQQVTATQEKVQTSSDMGPAQSDSHQQNSPQFRSENNRRTKRRSNSALSKTNEEILNSLKRILEKHEKEDRDYEVVQEWRRVAQCVDRILFFIFLIATFSSTLAILVIAPASQ